MRHEAKEREATKAGAVVTSLVDQFGLTDDERAELLPSGQRADNSDECMFRETHRHTDAGTADRVRKMPVLQSVANRVA